MTAFEWVAETGFYRPGDEILKIVGHNLGVPPVEIIRFKVIEDGQFSLVVDGEEIWTGPDATAFALWIRDLVGKERAAHRAGYELGHGR